MKKTLIALAVLGAFGAAHAQSNVTVYGQLNPSYDYVKASHSNTKVTTMSDNSSRVGFKGTEDLGGGLKAIFQLESYFDMVNEGGFNGDDGSRDAWVGLAGNFGSITFGAQDNALKKAFASYDPFGDTIADYNNIMSNGIDSRNSKSAFYTSPTISGVTAMVSYALDAQRQSNPDTNQKAKLAIALDYKNGPLQVTGAYDKLESGAASGGGDWKGYRLGAQYTLPTKTKLTAVFSKESGDNAKVGNANGQGGAKSYLVGVQHPINNIDLIANYIWAGDAENADDSGAKNLNLGVRYNFSKRTNVMAMYSWLKNDDAGLYSFDTSDGYGIGAAGEKFQAFSVRLQHNF